MITIFNASRYSSTANTRFNVDTGIRCASRAPNGAVITLLAVTGLTHRQSYKDIFAITCIKTMAVFVVIGVFYATGLV